MRCHWRHSAADSSPALGISPPVAGFFPAPSYSWPLTIRGCPSSTRRLATNPFLGTDCSLGGTEVPIYPLLQPFSALRPIDFENLDVCYIWHRVEKEAKKIAKKLKRLVVLVGQRRIFLSFVIFVLSLLIRVRDKMGDAKFTQFRDKGIDPELRSKIDALGHGVDIITPNVGPLPTLIQENEDMPFNIENNDISILGPGVSAWQELWHDNSPISTPPPVSQGVDGGANGKGKRKLENFSLDPNKSAKTNGPKRIRFAAMMYEKLDTMLEVIILERKASEREERREKRQRKHMNNKITSGDNGAPSVPDALAKICVLPNFDPMHQVFIFACELVEDPQKRMILFGFPNDDSRVQWLTYLYDKYGQK
ncbi:LOW QUALITY PROTEIN: hypothetical protein Cgig2_000969 [Carnegiea gigantea]|uniref:Uncharacterized protein n=1 Tax=Carnegiea gigantea TaxID=171969 RepID=A0A9Q1JLP0_9CARY|nr:LOW QUALITY PROTEIN: hypothetical protein Cgig2_000969 [Carnegiea gigantea]